MENRGHTDEQLIENFYTAGYNKGSLIETTIVIGDKTITNYLHALTDIPIDWPVAPEL